MHPEHPDPEAESMWMRQPGIINFSILPPNQSQEAQARQSAALPHTTALNTSGSCFAVFDYPIGRQQDRSPSDQPITPHFSPRYTSISPTFDPGSRDEIS